MVKTKKAVKKITKETEQKAPEVQQTDLLANLPADMPAEGRERIEHIKGVLDKFQKKALGKFEDYVMGIALLPPTRQEEVEQREERKLSKDEAAELDKQINILVLVDDADSKKMSKEELKDKLAGIFTSMAAEVDKHLRPETVILSELWQSCYDAKYDLIQMIAMAAPVYDKGMLAAIKIAASMPLS